jgi:hypothetical protein
MPQRPLAQFALGGLFGVVAALVSVALSLLMGIVAIVLVVFIGLLPPRFAMLSGGLLGLGVTWLVLVAGSVWSCQPADCQQANYLPTLLISLALTALGLAVGVITVSQSRRAR